MIYLVLDATLSNSTIVAICTSMGSIIIALLVFIYMRSLNTLDETAKAINKLHVWTAAADEKIKIIEHRTTALEDGHARHSDRLNTIEKEIQGIKKQ